MSQTIQARVIVAGKAEGLALVSSVGISFLGGVDADSGVIIEKGHPLEGQSVAGRILVFPAGKGSTVGSYVIYRLTKANLAPKAIINSYSEPIVAVGALIAGIPMVDHVDIHNIETNMHISIDEGIVCIG
jgi:predicted aconitase with swiveling domain